MSGLKSASVYVYYEYYDNLKREGCVAWKVL